jgi:uncharacterized protein YbjQ (UPF0145 family)
MITLTTDSVPENLRIVQDLGVFYSTYPIEVSDKGLIRGFLERSRNEHDEALNAFTRAAPAGTNLIYGMKVSTAAAVSGTRTMLIMTFLGTAARCEEKDRHEQPA